MGVTIYGQSRHYEYVLFDPSIVDSYDAFTTTFTGLRKGGRLQYNLSPLQVIHESDKP
jgi:hypothetical protein